MRVEYDRSVVMIFISVESALVVHHEILLILVVCALNNPTKVLRQRLKVMCACAEK